MDKVRFYEPIPERYVRYINNLIPQNENNGLTNNIIATICLQLAKDFEALGFNEGLLYFLFYRVVYNYYDLPKISYEEAYNAIKEAICTEEFAKRIKSYNPQSDFFIVFKRLYDDIDELEILLYEDKKYLALKKYRDILIRISEEAIDHTMSDKELAEELNKRLPIPYNNLKNYRRRMANKTFNAFKYPKEHPSSVVKVPGYSLGCHLLQNYLINLMQKYYQKTGYYYHPIDGNLEYFVLSRISVITYRYDDTFTPYFQVGNKELTFKDYGFWAICLSPDFKPEKIKQTINPAFKDNHYGDLIIAPYEYMEEALIKYANGNNYDGMTDSLFARELLTSIGMPDDTPITDKLKTNGKMFYKDFSKVDEIEVKDLSVYPTLERLQSEKTPEERNKYIRGLLAKYKGDQTRAKRKEQELKKEISQKKFKRKKASDTYRD